MCPTDLDADQVIKAIYDEPANRIRVDAAVTATFGDLEVTLRSDEDSVTIGNASHTQFAEVTSNSELKVKDDALDDTNNLLFGIDSTLTTLNSKFTSGTDIGDVTVNNAGGASAVNIQDGGNSITVDGTVTANAGTGNFTVVQPTGTNLHMVVDSGTITTITNVVHIDDNGGSITVDGTVAATQSGTWNINDIIGTIALPTGASTSANQTTINNSIQALQVTQGSTTSGELGPLVQGAVTTAAPTYVNGQTNPLSLTTAGALRVDGSATTQPVSGTVTANQGTSPWVVSGTITTSPDVNIHDGTGVSISSTGSSLNVNVTNTVPVSQSGTWNINNISGTISLPAGAATSALQTAGNVSLASIDSKIALDYGTSTQAIRTASQIGNTTGQADFNAGTTSAQTLRVVLPTNQTAIPVTQSGTWVLGANSGVDIGDVTINNGAGAAAVNIQDGGNSITVDGTVSASNFPTTVDTNYGTVGANTIRTAAQIGNATGAALFGAGTTTAQVLRVVLPTDQTVIPVQGQKTNNNAAPGATNIGTLPGIATAAIPTRTEGNQVALSTDLGGRQRVLNTPTTGILQTYSASASNLLSVASATDIFTITGSATKTIMITLITLSGTATSATVASIDLVKRSTADSAGTSQNLVEVPSDSTNAAATATVLSYTANPTLGTAVGTVRAFKCFLPPPTGGNANTPSMPIIFPHTFAQPITLRGTGEVLAFNLKGVTITGGSFNIAVEWVEI